jgi:hypothetical protein
VGYRHNPFHLVWGRTARWAFPTLLTLISHIVAGSTICREPLVSYVDEVHGTQRAASPAQEGLTGPRGSDLLHQREAVVTVVGSATDAASDGIVVGRPV